MDPLRLLWSLTATALAVIVAYLHAYPQAPYPSHGIAPSLGLVVLAAASVLIVSRAPWVRASALGPVLLPCIFLAWALWRTSAGLVPSEGIPLLGTLLEGSLIFAIALTLAAVGGRWRSFSLYTPAAAAESQSDKMPVETRPLFFDSAVVFFLALAVAMALWAVYQYFVLYDQQLVEFRLRYGVRGLAALSDEQWSLFEALRAKRVGSRFGNPNVLAGFLSMAVPLAIGAAVMWADRSSKAAALVILGVIWYVVLLTGSRGGMLTLLFATAMGVALLGRKTLRKHLPVLAVAAGVCIGAVLLAIAGESRAPNAPETRPGEPLPRARYSFFERLRTSPTIAQRLYYLQSGWEMIRRSPWMGQGLGSYAILYPKYKQPLAREARYPHNIFCHLWVETGLVGLLLWIVWIAAVVAIVIGRLRTTPGGVPATGIKMLLVAAMVFIFNNLFEMTWTFRETYLDWCLLMGIMTGLSADRPAASQPAPGSVRPVWDSLVIAATPLAVGIILANPLLMRPLIAESCETTATDLLKYGQGKEVVSEAFRLALRMIQYQPRNAAYHRWLAGFYQDTNRPADARREFEEALRLNPYSAAIRAEFADFEQKNGRPDDARRLLFEAIEIYPLNPYYHHALAELERKVGNPDAARKHIHDALKCNLNARKKPIYEQFLKDLDAQTSAMR